MHLKILVVTLSLAALLASIVGCDNTGESDYTEQLVLQGIMYTGESLAVRLVHSYPYAVPYSPSSAGVEGASGYIVSGSDTLTLFETAVSQQHGWYHVGGFPERTVHPGVSYRIHLEAEGQTLEASTVGVGRATIIYASADTVEYGDTEFRMRWQRDSLAVGYAVLVENLEPDYNAEYRKVSGNNGPDQTNWASWPVPNTEDSLLVPWVSLGFTGRHRVRLLTCDEALWDYVWTYTPGTVENYPVTNVHGGLGIFAAAGADTTYFVLTDSVSDGPSNP